MSRYPNVFGSIQHVRDRRGPDLAPSLARRWRGGALAVLAVTALTACSVHPIPDDVSLIPTEAIVAAARCELRLGLVEMVKVWFDDETPPVTEMAPDTIAEHLQE